MGGGVLARLARLIVRRRRLVLLAALGGFLVAGAVGGNVAKKLSSGGFEDPRSESARAEKVLEQKFNQGNPNFILVLTARSGSVDSPAATADAAAITARLSREPGMRQVASYWSLGSPPPLKSRDGRQALVLATIAGSQDDVHKRVEKLSPVYRQPTPALTVQISGFGEVFRQVGSQIQHDLATSESIAVPVTLLLLVFVFGSVVAAGLPVSVGALAVVGTFLVLRLLAAITEVSVFSLNMVTALGLGLAIDYSLFIVSRYREELGRGLATEDAIVRTVETAGRTVLFSAVTVGVSLAALLIFPLSFLRSFAYAGVPVVLVAATGATFVLPALLAALGPRIDKWVLWHHQPKPVGEGAWHRVAMVVMRRPWLTGGAVVLLLVLLGAPFLRAEFGLPDDRVLPRSASSRQAQDDLRANFASNEASAVTVVATGIGEPTPLEPRIDGYATALSRLTDVARVDALTGSYIHGQRVVAGGPVYARFYGADGTWLSVVPTDEALSAKGEALVHHVRALPRPFPVKVGGPSAQLIDGKRALFGRMPLAILLIAVVTFTVLFLMTGGVLVPIKALVLNFLSLSATFGAMVWIFQQGHLAGVLDFTVTGFLDTTTPILMFCIAFGLSMDYEVFLLSRIKEEHDRSGDNVSSVALGLERTGRIVTAAAALLAVVFLATAYSKITFIKLFGIGLTLAVVMDATLVRGVLVPAFMRLAGDANWWAPKPLRRLYDRFGLSEAGGDPQPERPEPVPVAGR